MCPDDASAFFKSCPSVAYFWASVFCSDSPGTNLERQLGLAVSDLTSSDTSPNWLQHRPITVPCWRLSGPLGVGRLTVRRGPDESPAHLYAIDGFPLHLGAGERFPGHLAHPQAGAGKVTSQTPATSLCGQAHSHHRVLVMQDHVDDMLQRANDVGSAPHLAVNLIAYWFGQVNRAKFGKRLQGHTADCGQPPGKHFRIPMFGSDSQRITSPWLLKSLQCRSRDGNERRVP